MAEKTPVVSKAQACPVWAMRKCETPIVSSQRAVEV
jgi:hypothetical protein